MQRRIFLASTALGLTLASTSPVVAQDVIDIPAQPLAAALTELATETGLQVTTTKAAVAGKVSAAVRGPLTPQAALRAMLSDTGLSIRTPEEDSAVLSFRDIASQNATDEEEPFNLDTLVIRGELIDRDVQDSQTSAVVTTGLELEERGETAVAQTLQRIPGVQTTNGLVIRGITEDGGLGNGTQSSTISVTTDGIRLSDYRNVSLTDISTWDVEQVEVFRGSQSTQTGRNALAGAVVVEGAKPKFFPEYRLRLGANRNLDFEDADPGYQAAFVLNTPLVEDQLAFRLSVDKRETDDFQDAQTIRASLLYEPTDQLSFGFTYSDIDNGLDVPTLVESPRLTVDYQINDSLTLTSRTQFTTAETGVDLGFFGRERDYVTVDQELRLIYETSNIRAVGGFFYTNIDEESALFTIGSGDVTGRNEEDIKTENYAIYGEVEYDFSPQWTFIAGARYDVEELDETETLNGLFQGVIPLVGSGSLDTTYQAFLPKLGVVYHFSQDQSLGFTYQRGYRAGGLSIAVPNSGGDAVVSEFDPEFTDTFELAYRSQSSDGRRIFNANAYYTKWTDQQVATTIVGGFPVIANTADSELWGAEFDYRQLVTDNLEVFASAALSRTRYGDYDRSGTQLRGNSFFFAPEVMASFGANYVFDSGFSIAGDVNYTSSTFSDAENLSEFENDSYWVTNVSASYLFDNGLALNAYARNLFDEDYTTQQTETGFIGKGPRREYGLFLTAEF